MILNSELLIDGGSTMYVTNDINDLGWDGLHKNEAQPAGIYVYYLTGKKASNMEVVISKRGPHFNPLRLPKFVLENEHM